MKVSSSFFDLPCIALLLLFLRTLLVEGTTASNPFETPQKVARMLTYGTPSSAAKIVKAATETISTATASAASLTTLNVVIKNGAENVAGALTGGSSSSWTKYGHWLSVASLAVNHGLPILKDAWDTVGTVQSLLKSEQTPPGKEPEIKQQQPSGLILDNKVLMDFKETDPDAYQTVMSVIHASHHTRSTTGGGEKTTAVTVYRGRLSN